MATSNTLSPQVLSNIALMESVVAQLPDKRAMMRFVCQGFKDISGVKNVDYQLFDEKDAQVEKNITIDSDSEKFLIRSQGKNHGYIVFEFTNHNLFSPYIPFVRNFLNMLAVIFDEQHQRLVNKDLMDTLEERVTERTRELKLEIKERKHAEKALKENEENLQITLNSIGDAVISTDLQGKIVRMNPVAEKLTGWCIDDAIGKSLVSVLNIVDSRTKEKIDSPVAKLIKNGEIEGFSKYTILVSKDGKEYRIGDSAAPILDLDKTITGVVLVFRDVTDEYRINELRDKEKKRLENIIKGTNAGTWDLNILTGELMINNRWAEIIGFSPDELKPITINTWFHSIHSDDVETVKQKLEDHFNGKDDYFDIDYRQLNKSKDWVWVNTRGKVIEWSDENRPYIMSGIHQDITEHKLATEALLESKRLGAFGEMASAVAHDFNNALQAILSNLELALLIPNIPTKVNEYLNTIYLTVSDATTRVKLLQRFAGSKVGQSNYKLISINSVIDDAIIQARPLWKDQTEKNGLKIFVETKFTDIANIKGNESELRAVFYNIFKNGIEAMPKGGKILIETKNVNDELVISVKDNGIGMDDETQAKVFQPFFSTKGFEAGRGLGMSGAYSIVSEHRGKIYIEESTINKGTTVILKFPIASGDIQKNVSQPIEDGTESARILWVDDDKMIREIAKDILDVLNYSSDITDSGVNALKLLNQNEYDLVITDIGMPGMTGWELAQKISEKYKNKITIAALTGWGDEYSEEDKKVNHVDHILSKPVRISDLQNLISRVLNNRNTSEK